jgi:hypothetical protein
VGSGDTGIRASTSSMRAQCPSPARGEVPRHHRAFELHLDQSTVFNRTRAEAG